LKTTTKGRSSSDSGFLEAAAHSKDGLWTEQDTFVSQEIEE